MEWKSCGRPLNIAWVVTLLCLIGSPLAGQEAGGSQRSGFTLLLDLGIGFQNDTFLEETKGGLGGLNLGIGGFLTENLALMFRASGTTADWDGFSQTSGVGGAALQYWLNDRTNLMGGLGVGFWSIEDADETGMGLILGAGYTIANRGKHNFQIGVEYSPAFTDPGTVHNLGITIGWQLF